MKKAIIFLIVLISFTSCGYENPSAITEVILTDEPQGSNSQDNVSVRFDMTYNSEGVSYPTYDSTLGYAVYVSNNSSNPITNVYISIESTNPTGFDYNGSNLQSSRFIGTINSGFEIKPQFNWTLNDGTIYVGNFYLLTPMRGIGYTSLVVTYKVIFYNANSDYRELTFTQTVFLN